MARQEATVARVFGNNHLLPVSQPLPFQQIDPPFDLGGLGGRIVELKRQVLV